MIGPGRQPSPPPKEFQVQCWKCRARIFLVMDTDRPLMGEDLVCPACGAPFIIRKRRPAVRAARSQDA